MTLDKGTRWLLSGTQDALGYLKRIGAGARMPGPDEARLDFFDLAERARWTIRPNAGALPWWLLSSGRRVPGTQIGDYLALARLAVGGAGRVSETIACAGPLWEKLIEPFLLAALNTA